MGTFSIYVGSPDLKDRSSSSPILVSPKLACTVYSLYDDVLLAIFLCCNLARLTQSEEDDSNSLSIRTSPWVLSHVCQHWRALVVSAPLLWTTIQLEIEPLSVNPSGAISRLETVLRRSGDHELNVEIDDVNLIDGRYSREQWKESRACVHSLIRVLLPTTARWRHLFIASSRDVFEALAGCSFGLLQSLFPYYYWEDDEEDASITLFRNATKLRELKLEGQVDLDIPRGGIQKFTTESSGLLLLPGMQNLQFLHIEDAYATSDVLDQVTSEWQDFGLFELPLLHTITVQEHTVSPVVYELSSHLRVTALKTLALLIWNRFDPPLLPHPLPAFDNLDSLVNLSIDFVEFDSPDTTSFLACASSVTNVYLGARVATPAVMEAIGAGLLPKMQTLGLNFSMMDTDA